MAAQPAPHRPTRRARPLTPRSAGFVATVLGPLRARAAAGEPTPVLAQELYEGWVHRWAVGEARAQAGRLPAHADRAEVTSQVLRLAWDACLRIDWDRTETFPAFLERKVGSASAEAARVDDWLSRRERTYRRHYQRAVGELEQTRGRGTTVQERRVLARACAPVSSRVDWERELLAARHPDVVADVPDIEGDDDVAGIVEAELMRIERSRSLGRWLAALSGEDRRLATDLRRWSEHEDERFPCLPARLARRVAPFTPLLAGLLVDA